MTDGPSGGITVARSVGYMTSGGFPGHPVDTRPTGPPRKPVGHRGAPWTPSADDSRVAKGEQTRRSVIASLVDLVDEGETHPTTRKVAHRAGVSVRLIYHHFGGLHGLLLAAVAYQSERHRNLLFAIPPRGPPELRIKALCRQRRLYFEEMTPVYRVAHSRAHLGAGLDALVAADRAILRSQLAHTLSPELTAQQRTAPELLDALEQATGWDTWRSLRDGRDHSAPSAERVIAFTAGCLLA
jgi:AcrR family transcriptional regulator